jgi:hypothetical protein
MTLLIGSPGAQPVGHGSLLRGNRFGLCRARARCRRADEDDRLLSAIT